MAQKFIAAKPSATKWTGQEVNAIHHFALDLSISCKDGTNTYSNLTPYIGALYPFVGPSFETHKLNMMDTTQYIISATGPSASSWSYSTANGANCGDGNNSLLLTNWTPSAIADNIGIGTYQLLNRNTNASNAPDIGGFGGYETTLFIRQGTSPGTAYLAVGGSEFSVSNSSTSSNLMIATRLNSSTVQLFYAGNLRNSIANTFTGRTTVPIGISGFIFTATKYYINQASKYGLGVLLKATMSTAQHTQFYNAVQTYQTNLNRAVAP